MKVVTLTNLERYHCHPSKVVPTQRWLKHMGEHFNAFICTEKQKVNCVAFMLERDADIWWETTKGTIAPNGQVVSWNKFIELFKEKYFSLYVRTKKKRDFINLVQGVEEYEAKFNVLSRYAPEIVIKHHDKVEMFENGLRQEIKEKENVILILSKTFKVAVEVAKEQRR